MQEPAFTALPQRPPRQRGRAVKRAKTEAEPGQTPVQAQDAQTGAQAAAAPDRSSPEQQQDERQQQDEQQQQDERQQQDEQQQQDERQQQDEQPQREQQDGEGAGGDETPPAAPQLDLPAYRSAAVRDHKFEYLDHTADVQLHAWGATLEEAFANAGLAMFNYMTPLKGVALDPGLDRRFEAEGHDLQSLLFNFLDELLFGFATDFFVARELRVTRLDRDAWRIEADGRGERFDRQRHACGTEVKAITYSAMQIREAPGDAEVFVIVDI